MYQLFIAEPMCFLNAAQCPGLGSVVVVDGCDFIIARFFAKRSCSCMEILFRRLCTPGLLANDPPLDFFPLFVDRLVLLASGSPTSGRLAIKPSRSCAPFSFFAGRRLFAEGFVTRADALALETRTECLILRLSTFEVGRRSVDSSIGLVLGSRLKALMVRVRRRDREGAMLDLGPMLRYTSWSRPWTY